MTTAGFPQFKTAQLTSSNIQLSSVPEKLILFARRIPSSLTPMDAESYLVIRDIRVNFNNSSVYHQHLHNNTYTMPLFQAD